MILHPNPPRRMKQQGTPRVQPHRAQHVNTRLARDGEDFAGDVTFANTVAGTEARRGEAGVGEGGGHGTAHFLGLGRDSRSRYSVKAASAICVNVGCNRCELQCSRNRFTSAVGKPSVPWEGCGGMDYLWIGWRDLGPNSHAIKFGEIDDVAPPLPTEAQR